MKYCVHCGNELLDDAVICPKCGCRVPNIREEKKEESSDTDLLIAITKGFMVLGCILSGFLLIPLLWTIPMTVSLFKKYDNKEKISMKFKILSLIFVSRIAGILMLVNEIDN